MRLTKEDVLEILRGIVAIVFIVGFIVVMVLCVKQCNTTHKEYINNLPPYKVRYGDFWGSETVYFYTYTVEGNRYLFYDKGGTFIQEFVVTESTDLSIESKR